MKARVTALALALTFVGASNAAAAAITINTLPGTTYTTSGINDFSATSSQMNGMQITAFWTVGSGAQQSLTQAWNSGVTFAGSGLNMSVTGDTFGSNAWDLNFNVAGTGKLQKLVFNGVPGNTVFDRTNPNTGTPGSDQGKDLAGFADYDGVDCGFFCWREGNIKATYFNQVVVGSNPFQGDIYAGLQIEFLDLGGLGEGNWEFSLDTDIATSALVTPVDVAAVPEPGSMVLLGTGLLGLAAAVRRRKARQS